MASITRSDETPRSESRLPRLADDKQEKRKRRRASREAPPIINVHQLQQALTEPPERPARLRSQRDCLAALLLGTVLGFLLGLLF